MDSVRKKQSTKESSELETEKTGDKKKLDQTDTNTDNENLSLMKIL